jgi:hypothetical protein
MMPLTIGKEFGLSEQHRNLVLEKENRPMFEVKAGSH